MPWRDLPEAFGRWNTVFRRFRRWACKGVFEGIFTALSGDPDFEYALVDGTIVRVHQHGAGAKGGTQAIGRSRGGLTTKIVALVDALGTLARFVLLPGQRHDSVGVEPLIAGVEFDALIADKAFDIDWIVAELDERGAQVVISQHPRRTRPRPIDADLYKWRHLIENFFGKLKDFKRIALRACKTDASFAAMIYAAAMIINSQ